MPKKQQIQLDSQFDAWSQQPGESGMHYGWFTAYQLAGRSRRVSDLTNVLGKSLRYLQRVAWAHRWKERAHAWDAEEDRRQAEQVEAARREANERRGKLGKVFAGRAAVWLAKESAEAQRVACRLAETAIRLDVSVYGAPERAERLLREVMAGAEPYALPVVPVSEEVRLQHLRDTLATLYADEALADLDPAALLYGPDPEAGGDGVPG